MASKSLKEQLEGLKLREVGARVNQAPNPSYRGNRVPYIIIIHGKKIKVDSLFLEEKDLIFIKEVNESRMVIALHINHRYSTTEIGKICREMYNTKVQNIEAYLRERGVQCLGLTNLNHPVWKQNKKTR